jgi:hypothetical protein
MIEYIAPLACEIGQMLYKAHQEKSNMISRCNKVFMDMMHQHAYLSLISSIKHDNVQRHFKALDRSIYLLPVSKAFFSFPIKKFN